MTAMRDALDFIDEASVRWNDFKHPLTYTVNPVTKVLTALVPTGHSVTIPDSGFIVVDISEGQFLAQVERARLIDGGCEVTMQLTAQAPRSDAQDG